MAESLRVLKGVADQHFTGLYEPIKQKPVLDRRPDAVRMAAHIGLLFAGEQAIVIANRGYEYADPMAEEPEIITADNFPVPRQVDTSHNGNSVDLEPVPVNATSFGDGIAIKTGSTTLAIAVPGFGVVHNVLEVVEDVSREGFELIKGMTDAGKIEIGEEKFGYISDIHRAITIAKLYNQMVNLNTSQEA